MHHFAELWHRVAFLQRHNRQAGRKQPFLGKRGQDWPTFLGTVASRGDDRTQVVQCPRVANSLQRPDHFRKLKVVEQERNGFLGAEIRQGVNGAVKTTVEARILAALEFLPSARSLSIRTGVARVADLTARGSPSSIGRVLPFRSEWAQPCGT